MNQEKDMDTDRKLPCGPEKDIGYYIKRINDKLKAGFDAYLCDVDLTSSQARVIDYVYWNGGMVTQKEIEERAALRKEYIESVRANLLGQLNNTVIQYPDGSRKKLERKPEAELVREREQREDEENRREVDAIRKR